MDQPHMAAYPAELEQLRGALELNPSSESAAIFAELARGAQQDAPLCDAVLEALAGRAAMASEFCMQVAALLRDSHAARTAAPGSLQRAFGLYETATKTTPEDFLPYFEMGKLR